MTAAPTTPDFTQDSNAVVIAGAAHGSANIVAQLKASAEKLYERAKAERQKLVRLAPVLRRCDKYNAEGEYLQNIKLAMGFRRIALQRAQKLESESSPNDES